MTVYSTVKHERKQRIIQFLTLDQKNNGVAVCLTILLNLDYLKSVSDATATKPNGSYPNA